MSGIKTWFGAWTGPDDYPTRQTKVEQRQAVCARYGVDVLPCERVFNGASWKLPDPGTGHQVISLEQNPQEVIDGRHDTAIEGFVTNLSLSYHYWLCYRHEADNPYKQNDPVLQRAAAARFNSVVAANRESPKVKTLPILMAYTLYKGTHEQWLPPAEQYDHIGFDAYWRPTTVDTAEKVFRPVLDYATSINKRLLIGETSCGAVHNLGQDQYGEPLADDVFTRYVTDMVPMLDQSDICKAVMWFEGVNSDGDGRLKDHPAALAAYAAAVQGS